MAKKEKGKQRKKEQNKDSYDIMHFGI